MIKRWLLLAMFAGCPPAFAGETPTMQAEIDHLLTTIEQSDCRFLRNGRWHSGAEARSHLGRKADHLQRRSAIDSTEQFIERGATASSLSGKPYLVDCGDSGPMPSAQWLGEALQRYRQS